jgi:hypothetical protein
MSQQPQQHANHASDNRFTRLGLITLNGYDKKGS